MSKGENFIHLKFEREEAVESKRDILTSEIDLINVMKSFRQYIALRSLELKTKARFHREMKKMITDIKKIEAALPQFEIPRILDHPAERKKEISESAAISTPRNNDLESQLQEIQRKLRELSG